MRAERSLPPPITFEEALPIVQAETRALLEAVIAWIEIPPARTLGARLDAGRVTDQMDPVLALIRRRVRIDASPV